VREEEVSQSGICGQSLSQKAEGELAQVVVAHVDLLDIPIISKGLRDGFNLLVCQLVPQQIQIFERQNFEQLGKCLATDFVIVDFYCLKLLALILKHGDQGIRSFVVDFIV
jgi:hypothetical protein